MTQRSPTIAFDVAPGNSGPGRYVASLVRGLEGSEFTVSILPPANAANDVKTVTSDEQPAELTLRRRIIRLSPAFVRHWLGFRREARRLAAAIRATGADIFHAQNTGCEEMPVAAKLAGVPRVLGTFHVDSTCDVDRLRSGITHRALEWYSNRSLHLAIAVSEATKLDWIRRTGLSAGRVATIHNGIDPQTFRRRQSRDEARTRLGLPQDALILGGVGRLDKAKGFTYLLNAAAELVRDFPKLHVALSGAGSLRQSLAVQAERRGIAPQVHFLGHLADVNPFLDALDVFVLPSLAETLGYALLEAMAHELPAVGTRVGGIPEVIVQDQTGFLAPPRDGLALASAIRPLLESSDLRERLGRAGRERVQRHFHERDMVRKTLDVYQRLLPSRQDQHLHAVS